MGERLLAETERPDGIFCANDVMAAGFMDLWQERVGLRAPRDYRIIGFDNTPIAAWSNYSMTSFDQDVDRMARIAVDMLCNFETTRDADRVVRANLVMRSSC
jgi:LacI family transcriptional regulator